MAFTTLTGLRIKVPTRGTRNWDAVLLTDTWQVIAQHRHTGDPDGLQIPTGGIADNAINGAKIRLANDQYLRARNQAGNGDLDLWKASTSNLLTQGILSSGFRLANEAYLIGRNNADDADINIGRVNSSDVIEFGQESIDSQFLGQLLLPTDATTSEGAIRYDANSKKYLGNDGSAEISIGGDDSWTMSDSTDGQITFNAGSRAVNGIVTDIASDITTNATVVALTDDTLTVVDASNGFLYEASDTVRIYTFYDIINEEFAAIGNSSDDAKWDYRNEDPDFDINLARYVPIGYVDVTATGSPGDVTVDITNWPVGSWTTFNNVAAAGPWETWSPTNSNSTNATLLQTRFRRVGNSVEFKGRIQWTGVGSGTTLTLSYPVAPSPNIISGSQKVSVGTAVFSTTGSAANSDVASCDIDNSQTGILFTEDGNTIDGSQFSSGGFLDFSGSYEISAADGYNPIAVAFPSINDLVTTLPLASNLTSDGVIAGLTTSNLTPGKTYKITAHLQVRRTAAGLDNIILELYDGDTSTGTYFGENIIGVDNGEETNATISIVRTFNTNTLTTNALSIDTDSSIRGNGTTRRTYVQIEEIPVAGIGVLLPRQDYYFTFANLTGLSATANLSDLSSYQFTLPKGSWELTVTAGAQFTITGTATRGFARVVASDLSDNAVTSIDLQGAAQVFSTDWYSQLSSRGVVDVSSVSQTFKLRYSSDLVGASTVDRKINNIQVFAKRRFE